MPPEHHRDRHRRVRRRKRRRMPRIEDAGKYFAEEEQAGDDREAANAGLVIFIAVAILLILSISYILKSVAWEEPF